MQDRTELIESCIPLVHHIASRHAHKDSLLSFEDMVSEGYIGLVQAANRYDPSRGAKFSTFASTRIHGAIIDALREEAPLSRSSARGVAGYAAQVAELSEELGHEPSDSEVAASLDIPVQKASELRRMQGIQVLSLNKRTDEFNEDYEDGEESTEDTVISSFIRTSLRGYVARLMPRERQIIERTYWNDERHSSIARDLGISESRVSQIQKRALGRIRSMIEQDGSLKAA